MSSNSHLEVQAWMLVEDGVPGSSTWEVQGSPWLDLNIFLQQTAQTGSTCPQDLVEYVGED